MHKAELSTDVKADSDGWTAADVRALLVPSSRLPAATSRGQSAHRQVTVTCPCRPRLLRARQAAAALHLGTASRHEARGARREAG